MHKSAMLAAVAAAATGGAIEGAGDIKIDAGFIKEHLPEVAAVLVEEGRSAGKAEGSAAERARIAGIEKAALPGHEAIIKAHKDDPTKTAADAAMAIIAAENATRGGRMAALDADEDKAKVRSEPANPAQPAAPSASAPEGEAKWKADYAADAKLQAEFGGEGNYLALKRAESSGLVRRLKNRAA